MNGSSSPIILLSIQSEHAQQIYAGSKRAELRKSFPIGARLVFLYETAPVAAVTGAFVVGEARRLSVSDAIELAQEKGVNIERARKYYGEREEGWVVGIGEAVKFKESIAVERLKQLNHYFSVPQAFAYLVRYEALTQEVLSVFLDNIYSQIVLRDITKENRESLSRMIRTEVASAYEDIDEDFIRQVLDVERGAEAAFSTVRKHVCEVGWRGRLIGFTVLTEKVHGAWKTGPSILLPEYRGIKYGGALRRAIERYCEDRGVRRIYCTCSDARGDVVAYLLTAGMSLQARLVAHLARNRDELVFAKALSAAGRRSGVETRIGKGLRKTSRVVSRRILSSDPLAPKVVRFFSSNLHKWYFRPTRELDRHIIASLKSYESGATAYSSKARVLYATLDSKRRPIAALLVTMKRSNMAKLNFVLKEDARDIGRSLLTRALVGLKEARRLYGTVPGDMVGVIAAFHAKGFSFEGLLQDPFSTGMDHACFGLVRRTGQRELQRRMGKTESAQETGELF